MRAPHPAAELFPLMDGDEYAALVADVKANGLIEPIWLDKTGRVLDGRNRLKACKDSGIQPHFRTWEGVGSAVEFVLSLNLHRRNLNTGQRALIAVDVKRMLAEEAEKRSRANLRKGDAPPPPSEVEILPPRGTKSRDEAGKKLGVSGRSVQAAQAVETNAPDLVEHVRSGAMSLAQAVTETKRREEDGKDSHMAEQHPSMVLVGKFDQARRLWFDKVTIFDPVEVADAYVHEGQMERVHDFVTSLRSYASRMEAQMREATKLKGVQ